MKQIAFSKAAIKVLKRMPADESRRIRAKIEQYASDPASLASNVKKLQGRPGFRLRVGDWRVIFDENDAVVAVLQVGPRGGIYE